MGCGFESHRAYMTDQELWDQIRDDIVAEIDRDIIRNYEYLYQDGFPVKTPLQTLTEQVWEERRETLG